MSSLIKNLSLRLPTRSDTNRAVQPQDMPRGLKFQIQEVEGLYYLCSEKKGADQLRGYRAADLRFLFAYAKSWFSHGAAHILSIFREVRPDSKYTGRKRKTCF